MMKSEDYTTQQQQQQQQQNVIITTNSTQQNTSSTQIYQTYHPHPSYLNQPPHFLSPPPHYSTPSFKKPKYTPTTSSEEGGTIELSRRPRGRPPGSKNKPKPPTVITMSSSSSQPAMSPYILELPPNSDLVDSLQTLTRRRRVGLCVLTATGAVINVTLKQPPSHGPASSAAGGTVTFHGRFDILSLSACILYSEPNSTTHPHPAGMEMSRVGGFTISLAGPQGQIVGGKVVGPLVCATTVYVVATSFSNPSYCKLPLEGGEDEVDAEEDGKNNEEYYNGEGSSGGQNMVNLVNYG